MLRSLQVFQCHFGGIWKYLFMCLPCTPPPHSLPTPHIDSTLVFWIALQLLLAIFAFAGRFCASPIKSICESRAALMHARAFINRRPRPQRPPVLLSRIYTQHTQCTALAHTQTHTPRGEKNRVSGLCKCVEKSECCVEWIRNYCLQL